MVPWSPRPLHIPSIPTDPSGYQHTVGTLQGLTTMVNLVAMEGMGSNPSVPFTGASGVSAPLGATEEIAALYRLLFGKRSLLPLSL